VAEAAGFLEIIRAAGGLPEGGGAVEQHIAPHFGDLVHYPAVVLRGGQQGFVFENAGAERHGQQRAGFQQLQNRSSAHFGAGAAADHQRLRQFRRMEQISAGDPLVGVVARAVPEGFMRGCVQLLPMAAAACSFPGQGKRGTDGFHRLQTERNAAAQRRVPRQISRIGYAVAAGKPLLPLVEVPVFFFRVCRDEPGFRVDALHKAVRDALGVGIHLCEKCGVAGLLQIFRKLHQVNRREERNGDGGPGGGAELRKAVLAHTESNEAQAGFRECCLVEYIVAAEDLIAGIHRVEALFAPRGVLVVVVHTVP